MGAWRSYVHLTICADDEFRRIKVAILKSMQVEELLWIINT
jgi:hypothetical protein